MSITRAMGAQKFCARPPRKASCGREVLVLFHQDTMTKVVVLSEKIILRAFQKYICFWVSVVSNRSLSHISNGWYCFSWKLTKMISDNFWSLRANFKNWKKSLVDFMYTFQFLFKFFKSTKKWTSYFGGKILRISPPDANLLLWENPSWKYLLTEVTTSVKYCTTLNFATYEQP